MGKSRTSYIDRSYTGCTKREKRRAETGGVKSIIKESKTERSHSLVAPVVDSSSSNVFILSCSCLAYMLGFISFLTHYKSHFFSYFQT